MQRPSGFITEYAIAGRLPTPFKRLNKRPGRMRAILRFFYCFLAEAWFGWEEEEAEEEPEMDPSRLPLSGPAMV